MADLLVYVDQYDRQAWHRWQDGDVMVAISDHCRLSRLARIAWQDGCPTGPGVLVRHSEGEYQGGGLHEEIHKTFHRWRARVVSATEVEYSADGVTPFVVDATPVITPLNRNPVHIHLPEFLAHRRASGRRLFRDPVSGEIRWYQRETPEPSKAKLDALWQKLRFGHGWQAGGHRPLEYWPFGKQEIRRFLPLYVEDFTHDDVIEWMITPRLKPSTDPTDRPTFPARSVVDPRADTETPYANLMRSSRREYQVRWRDLAGMSASHHAQVLDRTRVFDRRRDHQPYVTRQIVEAKI